MRDPTWDQLPLQRDFNLSRTYYYIVKRSSQPGTTGQWLYRAAYAASLTARRRSDRSRDGSPCPQCRRQPDRARLDSEQKWGKACFCRPRRGSNWSHGALQIRNRTECLGRRPQDFFSSFFFGQHVLTARGLEVCEWIIGPWVAAFFQARQLWKHTFFFFFSFPASLEDLLHLDALRSPSRLPRDVSSRSNLGSPRRGRQWTGPARWLLHLLYAGCLTPLCESVTCCHDKRHA